MQSVRSWANQTLEAEATKTLFGSFATFLGASPDDAGGAELGWLFASVLQNVGNNLVKGGMNRVTLALAEHARMNCSFFKPSPSRAANISLVPDLIGGCLAKVAIQGSITITPPCTPCLNTQSV
jgi:hypothetical protein